MARKTAGSTAAISDYCDFAGFIRHQTFVVDPEYAPLMQSAYSGRFPGSLFAKLSTQLAELKKGALRTIGKTIAPILRSVDEPITKVERLFKVCQAMLHDQIDNAKLWCRYLSTFRVAWYNPPPQVTDDEESQTAWKDRETRFQLAHCKMMDELEFALRDLRALAETFAEVVPDESGSQSCVPITTRYEDEISATTPAPTKPPADREDGPCCGNAVFFQGKKHPVPKGNVYLLLSLIWKQDSVSYDRLNDETTDPLSCESVRKLCCVTNKALRDIQVPWLVSANGPNGIISKKLKSDRSTHHAKRRHTKKRRKSA